MRGGEKFKMVYVTDELYHHGIKGQRWGIRRYQNPDGTLTEAGEKRYLSQVAKAKSARSLRGNLSRLSAKVYETNQKYYEKHGNKGMANANKIAKEAQLRRAKELDKKKVDKKLNDLTPEGRAKIANRNKKIAAIGAAAIVTGLAAYGGYSVYSKNRAMKSILADAAAREKREEGEAAIRAMYDNWVKDAMKNPDIKSFQINDDRVDYHISVGNP
jgi:hypothetical protein